MVVPPMRRRATLTIAAGLALLVSPGCGNDGGTPAAPPLPVPRAAASPTLVALTGAELPARPYDGLDISRLLTGEVDRIGGQGIDGGRELVFWQQDGPGGLRSGKWKHLRPGLWSGTATLFDLEADPGEKNDLSLSRPELVRQLDERLKELIGG